MPYFLFQLRQGLAVGVCPSKMFYNAKPHLISKVLSLQPRSFLPVCLSKQCADPWNHGTKKGLHGSPSQDLVLQRTVTHNPVHQCIPPHFHLVACLEPLYPLGGCPKALKTFRSGAGPQWIWSHPPPCGLYWLSTKQKFSPNSPQSCSLVSDCSVPPQRPCSASCPHLEKHLDHAFPNLLSFHPINGGIQHEDVEVGDQDKDVLGEFVTKPVG